MNINSLLIQSSRLVRFKGLGIEHTTLQREGSQIAMEPQMSRNILHISVALMVLRDLIEDGSKNTQEEKGDELRSCQRKKVT